jgi:hypothetical protein
MRQTLLACRGERAAHLERQDGRLFISNVLVSSIKVEDVLS